MTSLLERTPLSPRSVRQHAGQQLRPPPAGAAPAPPRGGPAPLARAQRRAGVPAPRGAAERCRHTAAAQLSAGPGAGAAWPARARWSPSPEGPQRQGSGMVFHKHGRQRAAGRATCGAAVLQFKGSADQSPMAPHLVAQRAGQLLLCIAQQAQLVVSLAQARLPPPVLVAARLCRSGLAASERRRTAHWQPRCATAPDGAQPAVALASNLARHLHNIQACGRHVHGREGAHRPVWPPPPGPAHAACCGPHRICSHTAPCVRAHASSVRCPRPPCCCSSAPTGLARQIRAPCCKLTAPGWAAQHTSAGPASPG